MSRTVSLSSQNGNESNISTAQFGRFSQMSYKPFKWYRLVLYDLLLWFLSISSDCFFREIRSRGAFKIPKTGPVIFVGAPHANQFIDPVILMNQIKRESNRRVSFLVAKKSYDLLFIGAFSRTQMAIPVERAQDNLKPGEGKIFVNFQKDDCVVTGVDTKFTQMLKPKSLLALPNSLGASEVLEVIDDQTVRIRKPFNNSDKIIKLLHKGTNFKYADKIDQHEVYNQVFGHLSHNQCLGIFPEGGSHDRTELLPIKAGVAIIALGAMANDPSCKVKIVPCGMNYFNAHKFRSRAVIEYGDPIEISQELVAKYKDPLTTKEAVSELLQIITGCLKDVTVTCDSYETLMVIQAARRLYAQNFSKFLPLPLVIEMNRRLVLGYNTFKNEPQIQALKARILQYNEKLSQLYLPDHDVESFDENSKLRNLGILIHRIIKLWVFVILALPGSILFLPVFIIAKRFSNKKQKAALAGSLVKVKANDVVATWKILVSLGLAPIFYILYASIAFSVVKRYYDVQINGVLLFIGLYCFNVLITYSALITGEQGMDIFKSLRPLYLSLLDGSSIRELKLLRKELSEEITAIVNEFGSKLFPNDFNLFELTEEEEDEITRNLKLKRNRRSSIKDTNISASNSSTSLSSQFSSSSSVSDGVSLITNSQSYSNIPILSDWQLHENKDSVMTPNDDDYSMSRAELRVHSRAISRQGSHLELLSGGFDLHQKLTERIKMKMKEKRQFDKLD